MERVLSESRGTADTTRARVEEALRDTERAQTEARTLRDSLTARDATIAQVMHSLGERDAQLHALQREHAQIVPTLEPDRERACSSNRSCRRRAAGRSRSIGNSRRADSRSPSWWHGSSKKKVSSPPADVI